MSKDTVPGSPEANRQDTSGERRREARRVLTSRCLVLITAPAWAITPRPMVGRTININSVGMKIGSIPVQVGQPTAWSEAIADDVDLRVEIHIDDHPNLPTLEGRVVWVYPDEASSDGSACQIGILFSVMKEPARQALAALVDHLPERF